MPVPIPSKTNKLVMKTFALLYFLAFGLSLLSAQAQRLRPASHRHAGYPPSKQVMPVKPVVLARLSAVQSGTLVSVSPALPAPAGLVSAPKASDTLRAMPGATTRPLTTGVSGQPVVQVANPHLVESLRAKPYLLPIDRSAVRGSYPLGISDRKTTHIIFPAKIREFDAGTDYVLAQVPPSVTNVLRVKANPNATGFLQEGTGAETNMTVMTEDGGFYSFLLRYQAEPEILNINIANNVGADDQTSRAMGINRSAAVPLLLPATSGDQADLPEAELAYQCQRVADRKSTLRNIGASKLRISALLTGIYVSGRVMYLQFQVRNDSQIDYAVDFFKFYVRDQDVLKRMAAQELELKPLARYPETLTTFRAGSDYRIVYAVPAQTLTQDKVVDIELYEKEGGRHLRFPIDSDILQHTKPL